MTDWVCYLITSLDSNKTYVGASNNPEKRLCAHNNNNSKIKRVGARATQGETWVPIIFISGFEYKKTCLSFETGWKRLAKRRNNSRLNPLNEISDLGVFYNSDTKWNRLVDLLYFVHNFTYIEDKFKINPELKWDINSPKGLIINIFMEDWIQDFPWPYFVKIKKLDCLTF